MMIQVNPDFDIEAYRRRYDVNSMLIDPILETSVKVCRRAETSYRSRKYNYLNINRIPLEFAARLEKGYPLVLNDEKRTYLLEVNRNYPAAKKWQNITCKILNNPLEFCEVLDLWQTSHQPTPATSTT